VIENGIGIRMKFASKGRNCGKSEIFVDLAEEFL
jgi:hypothetical protein